MDGNVLRVLARLTGDRRNVLLPQTKKEVSSALADVIPPRAGAFNEGLMELGEVVCLPNGAPLCGSCPLREYCAACRDGLCDALPVRIKEQKRRQAALSVFLLHTPDGRLALNRRPDGGLLGGMYELPNIEGHYTEAELNGILRDWGLDVRSLAPHKSAKHIFTHIEWNMQSYSAAVGEPAGRFIWATEEERKTAYPLPTAFQKLLK